MSETRNPAGWPYGAGSIQKRGRVIWMIFRDPQGRVIQENTGLEDIDAARALLAERSIETLRATIATLEGFRNEAAKTAKTRAGAPGHSKAGDGDERRSGDKAVRRDPESRAARKGAAGRKRAK